jgi:DNA-binding NarL/FixJ family response regulator
MAAADREIHLARALIVDNNALMRSVLAEQLRDSGVSQITQASRISAARLLLERETFDIVICNREFEGTPESGQDLLDELRREHQLPHGTVFLMVTSQASYHQVMEAAEAALDGILIRPYSAALLRERLMQARDRKRELSDVLRALDDGELEVAFARALKRFQEQQPYAAYCGRLAAELLLRMSRPDDAKRLFERMAHGRSAREASWAHLGVARAQLASGDVAGTRKALVRLLEVVPEAADAHDLMGRILVEQCDFDGALAEYLKASELTPGCLLRTQHAGALAFYQGQGEQALKLLQRTLSLGVQSKLFDALTLLLIALLRFDGGDAQGVASMREQLQRYAQRFPDSLRLRRFGQAAGVLATLLSGTPGDALQALRTLSAQAGDDNFDLEAANVVLALWARVPVAQRPGEEHAAVTERIGMRFCVAKAITEVLVASARRTEPAQGVIRACQARVAEVAEQAMDLSMRGNADGAGQLLVEAGERTLNAKLLEMTLLLARRHREAMTGAEALHQRASALMQRSCQAVNHIAGIQRSGRAPGALQLRGRAADPTPEVAGTA